MRNLKNARWLYLFCLIVAFTYISITLAIDVLHNHQDVGKLHDDCAACRWIDQSQDTSISTTAAQAFLIIPVLCGTDLNVLDESSQPSQLEKLSFSIRPPPSV